MPKKIIDSKDIEIQKGQFWESKGKISEVIFITGTRFNGFSYEIFKDGKITAKNGFYTESFIRENFDLIQDVNMSGKRIDKIISD